MIQKIRKGQGLTEFALILPVLLLVLLGIVEAAWIIFAYITVQNTAREAARYAVSGAPLDAQGNPWTFDPIIPKDGNPSRAEAIINEAEELAGILPVDIWAVNQSEFDKHRNAGTPQALGIFIMGQTGASVSAAQASGDDSQAWVPDHPGEKGLNILVRVYYNAQMLDPIYNGLMLGNSIHLNGEVILQNEGVNLVLGSELPDFAPPGGAGIENPDDDSPTDKGISVRETGGDTVTEIPAGSDIDISISNHDANTEYAICLGGVNIGVVKTNEFGSGTLSTYTIPVSTPTGPIVVSSSLDGCASSEADTTLTILEPDQAIITVLDAGHSDHAWPDNSLVTLKVVGHDSDTEYDIYFDSSFMPDDNGDDTVANHCKITTNSLGTGQSLCAVPNDISGDYPISTTVTVDPYMMEVINASVEVDGGNNVSDNTLVNIILRQHAPDHSYHTYFGLNEVGSGVTTNGSGDKVVSYFIARDTSGTFTLQTQDRNLAGELPPSIKREIASDSIVVTPLLDPAITIVGSETVPAGEPLFFNLRNHSPNTTYHMKIGENVGVNEEDLTPTFMVTTDANGDALNIEYNPVSFNQIGTPVLISYLSGYSVYSATKEITVLSSPRIVIEGGDRHLPGETITIYLEGHTPNTTYDVYLDLDSDTNLETDELIKASIVTDNNGQATLTYTIPKDISPTGDINPDPITGLDPAHAIVSRREGDTVDVAETNLYVIEANLTVEKIVLPPEPQAGVDLPIELHIKNTTQITLTGFPFDNDLYVNPPAGILNYTLPPGEQKIWIDGINPYETIVITPVIKLYNIGSYNLLGRTDTSNQVNEGSLENDNSKSITLDLGVCKITTPVLDEFQDGSLNPWTLKGFGDGGGDNWLVAGLNQEPTELLAARPYTIEPAALMLVKPSGLPVVQAASYSVAIETEAPAATGSGGYNVEPAGFRSAAAAIPLQAPVTKTYTIANNNDDASEVKSSNNVFLSEGGVLNLVTFGNNTKLFVGLRFTGIDIPKDAQILNAYIEFTAEGTSNQSSGNITIYGENSGNAAAFQSSKSNISGRTKTSNFVTWSNTSDWGALEKHQTTPPLNDIMQGIVQRNDWSSGNAMVFILDSTQNIRRRAYSGASGTPDYRPKLVVSYDPNPPAIPTECIVPTGYISPTTWGAELDIGAHTEPGYVAQSGANNIYTCGAGTIVSGASDDFYYYYKAGQSGDLEFKAHVTGWTPNADEFWSKAGLMLRKSTATNSAFFQVIFDRDNEIQMQARPATGNNADAAEPGAGAPSSAAEIDYWLAIRKVGNQVIAYRSKTGSGLVENWDTVGSAKTVNEFDSGTFLVGFAVAGYGSLGKYAQATFENVSITPITTAPPGFDPPTGLSATPGTSGSDYIVDLSWTDKTSDEEGFIVERLIDQSADPSDPANWIVVSSSVPASAGVDGTVTFQDTVACGTTYTYRVRAFKDGGGTKSNPSNTADATTAACPAGSCTNSGEFYDAGLQKNVLTLCSAGTGVTQNNDNNAGYMFMNQPVDHVSFEVVARVLTVPTTLNDALAGLEIRESLTDPAARKVDLVVRNQSKQIRAYTRETSGSAVSPVENQGWKTIDRQPVWLRIVRANGKFFFYYNAYDDELPVLGAWTELGSTIDTMPQQVYVGLVNASAGVARDASTWEYFSVGCVAVPATLCGAVNESGGTSVIQAINYTDNFPASSGTETDWTAKTTTVGSEKYAAMFYSGSDYDKDNYFNAPMLEYSVNIAEAGNYYLWLLGYTNSSTRDEVHLGLNGVRQAYTVDAPTSSTSVRWTNKYKNGDRVVLNLSQGVHTINIWGAEDGYELIQLLLTNKTPTQFTPPSNTTYDQSSCLEPVPPEFPPALKQCTAPLRNADFEETDKLSGSGEPLLWNHGLDPEKDLPFFGGDYAHGGSIGVGMLNYYQTGGTTPLSPFVYQTFNMPLWLRVDSTAELKVWKNINQEKGAKPNDKLFFEFRDRDGVSLTTPVEVATGADDTVWRQASVNNVFTNLTVDYRQIAGKAVRGHFYMPNPNSDSLNVTTDFYVDDVYLKICTTQPKPVLDKNGPTGRIEGYITVDVVGGVSPIQGVSVWLYRLDPPGPMQRTYTINAAPGEANYSFLDLEPGTYTVYAEYLNSANILYTASGSKTVLAGKKATLDLTLLRR